MDLAKQDRKSAVDRPLSLTYACPPNFLGENDQTFFTPSTLGGHSSPRGVSQSLASRDSVRRVGQLKGKGIPRHRDNWFPDLCL